MESAERTQIILAAVAAAGPIGEDRSAWNDTVAELAASITAVCSSASPASAAVNGVLNSKVFIGSVFSLEKEASSTRGLVTLITKPTQFHPDGREQARTARTDNPDGLAMARNIRTLVGHRVRIWVEVEEYDNGAGKVRVVRHIEDMGIDPSIDIPS